MYSKSASASLGHPLVLLSRAHSLLLRLAVLYAVLIVVLTLPPVQRHLSYLYGVKLPQVNHFDTPERYGLAPGKTLNLHLTTPDNVTLGAWFIYSDPYYQSLKTSSPSGIVHSTRETVRDALRDHPTILFFHGAAHSRASQGRIQHYSAFSSRLHTNVLAIDYRGFGDSSGIPTEASLELDAIAAWKWLTDRGAIPENILIVGHSLGTGVSGKLAKRLVEHDIKPRGIVLLNPFTDFHTLIETYAIAKIPILYPLQQFPLGRRFIKRFIYERYDTLSVIHEFNVPILIAHSTDDTEIPHIHSRTLINQLISPLLPPQLSLTAETQLNAQELSNYEQTLSLRNDTRNAIIKKSVIPHFGTVEEFDGLGGRVVYVETSMGKHNRVGTHEGVQDEIARLFKLGGGC